MLNLHFNFILSQEVVMQNIIYIYKTLNWHCVNYDCLVVARFLHLWERENHNDIEEIPEFLFEWSRDD